MAWIDPLPRLTASACSVVILAALGACSVAGPRSSPLPKDGPTLVDVYREQIHSEGIGAASPREQLPLRAPDDEAEARMRRTDLSPLQQRFQRLANPDLVMHVYPHLQKGRYPVPGYVTVFPMYDTVEYALPGEAAERHRGSATPVDPAPGPATQPVALKREAPRPCATEGCGRQ